MFYVYATDIAHKDFNRGICMGRFETKGRAMNIAKRIHESCDLVESMVMDSKDCMIWCSFAANETVMTVYPNAYFGIYDALKAACPLDAFPAPVQAYLTDMASAGLVKIDLGSVTRLLQPRHSDFAKQLKTYLAKEAA